MIFDYWNYVLYHPKGGLFSLFEVSREDLLSLLEIPEEDHLISFRIPCEDHLCSVGLFEFI